MPGTTNRDLASAELWQESLVRSRRRRVLAEDARKDHTRKKTASFAVTAAVAAAPMWPSVTATAADLSKDDVGKLARNLDQHHEERVLLAYGDTSSSVAELQRALHIADDGIFGPQTRAAVRAFQREHGLLPSGKVDVKTWLKLFPTDMIVYAAPHSASALGVNNTDNPEWAAVNTDGAAGPGGKGSTKAASSGKAGGKQSAKGGDATVHAASASVASIGATRSAVAIGPNTGGPGAGGGVPGSFGGALAPNGGGGGGGGGGSFHFPPLSSFGSAKEMISAMIRMANRIDSHHYAYSWGGGHNSSFSGPYDCSGAVSAVLHAAGLLGSPRVSGGFMHWGAPGRGAVTIYANASHVYMSILGHYFGTSHANPGGGAGWFPGGPRAGFAVVHVPFSALHLKHHKRHRRHKRHARRQVRQRRGPLNQPASTPPPSTTGGSTAAPPSSSPPSSTTPSSTAPAATTASSNSYSPPAQSAPVASQQAAATPNPQPAVTSAPAPSAPAPVQTPSAGSVNAGTGTGSGSSAGSQSPNASVPARAPAAPVGTTGVQHATSPAPAADPNAGTGRAQSTPAPVSAAKPAVAQTSEAANAAAQTAAQKPKAAGQAPAGSGTGSSSPN